MGSQFPLEVAGEEYFIDLLLYHRGLSCLLAIDLKVGAFKPEHAGKMQFYLTALDRQVREARENPSIGLIFCREKNRTIVEYALHDTRKPIGVATYRIVRRLPKELKGQLPDPGQIAKLLEAGKDVNRRRDTVRIGETHVAELPNPSNAQPRRRGKDRSEQRRK